METLLNNWQVLPAGLAVTLWVAVLAILIGTPLGLLAGLGLVYGPWWLRLPLRAYVDIVRGLPLLVMIFVIFYGPVAFNISMPRIDSVILALGIFAGAHTAEIARGAVSAIPSEQTEAAKSIGLTFWRRMGYVILPQATGRAVPPWINLTIEIVKGTSLVSLVSVSDLFLSARHVLERTRDPIPFYIALAAIYFLLNYGLSRIGACIERRFSFAI